MRIFLRFLPFVVPVVVYACSDDDTATTNDPVPDSGAAETSAVAPPPTEDAAVDAGPLAISLAFAARVGEQPFRCNETFDHFGTTDASVQPGDLRFFVSEVKLLRADGGEAVPVALVANEMQNARVALLDFEDKTGKCSDGTAVTNDTIVGTVPAGTYRGITFTVGVPEDLNHINTALAEPPLLGSDMQWGWTAGFKHMSMGFAPTTVFADSGSPAQFYAHIGSGGCAADAGCTNPNRPAVTLADFDPTTSKIVFDIRELFRDSDLNQNLGGPGGCMSGATDPECPAIFARLGLNDAGASYASPVIFSVAPR